MELLARLPRVREIRLYLEIRMFKKSARRPARRRIAAKRDGSQGAEALEPRLLLATFRTIDGSGNNLTPPGRAFGVAGANLIRSGYDAEFPDGFGDQITSGTAPNPRDVSNAVSAQDTDVYSARNLSDWIVQWGQFLTHDVDFTGTAAANNELSTGATGDFSIPITDINDPLGPNAIPFNRSDFDPTTGDSSQIPIPGPGNQTRPNWREQINDITSFIDASNVYGSDTTRANNLRTFVNGKLKTTAGGLLPGLNDAGEENDNAAGHDPTDLFLAGDVRSNEAVGLTATHALFVREHNRLADLLKAEDATLSDEEIYQWARKIVGAEMQIITYKEFLPALMGTSAPDPNAYVYDVRVDATITTSFSTAFFRFGHSQQSSTLKLVNDDGSMAGEFSLANIFFNPDILQENPSLVDQVMKGLASQVSQENDVLVVDEIRNFLFGPPGAGGLDLAALDIQRGRDHGMLDFNEFRMTYMLPRLNNFAQLTSDTALQAELQTLYGNINNVDAWVGGIAEDHMAGKSIGAMLNASFIEQFTRTRDGDRFFYTGDADLNDGLVTSVIDLDNLTLASIIRNNTGITDIQDNVFFTGAGFSIVETDGNTAVSESATTDMFAVTLNRAPASNVVLTITTGNAGEATIDKTTLTFTPANWSVAQVVTVTGVDDTISDGDQVFNITVSVTDASSDDDFDSLQDQTVPVTTTDDEVATFDLIATSFDAINDHVIGGETDVAFTVENSGSGITGSFDTHVVWSANDILGDDDDVRVVGSATTFAGLAANASESVTISILIDQSDLYANALTADPAGQAVNTVSQDVSRLFLVVDSNNDVSESDEQNNSSQGHLVDSDDITYFPWDTDSNGTVTPLEALAAIQAIGSTAETLDADGNGIVTPLEALATIQRIGYVRDNSVVGDSPPSDLQLDSFSPPESVPSETELLSEDENSVTDELRSVSVKDMSSEIIKTNSPTADAKAFYVEDDEDEEGLFVATEEAATPTADITTKEDEVAVDTKFGSATDWLSFI